MGKFAAVHTTTTTVTALTERPVRRSPGIPRRRVLCSGAAALALVAALAACTGDTPAPPPASATAAVTSASTASAAPTPSTTPTPTALPSASDDFSSIDLTVPPPRPDALDAPPSKEAAGEIAEYFLLLFPYAAVTHDLGAFKELTYSGCGYCNQVIKTVQAYEAKGIVTEGGGVIVSDVEVSERDAEFFTATITFEQAPSREIASDGSVVDEGPGGRMSHEIDVLYEDGDWLITSWIEAS